MCKNSEPHEHEHQADETCSYHNHDSSYRREFLNQALSAATLLMLPSAYNFAPHKNQHDSSASSDSSPVTMAAAATAFWRALNSEQQDKATFPLNDARREEWYFTPKVRHGITLNELNPKQQKLALALLATGLSQQGLSKANTIRSLEDILKEIEQGKGPVRDRDLYYFSIFGKPQSKQPWGWRYEGHHNSLNYTIINDRYVATAPIFFGCNPAEVRHGARQGLRTLPDEEDLARVFVKTLDDAQRKQVLISKDAPKEILTTNARKVTPLQTAGIQVGKLGSLQTEALVGLLRHYAANMPADVAARRLEKLRQEGISNIFFAWAGSFDVGQGHYYRIQGPSFLIEYDNTQNYANHIHTVWRDFNGDFGHDLLAEHYQNDHRRE